MKNYLDYPCICGHVAGHHTMLESNMFKYCCVVGCHCDDYKPDNLRFLEMQKDVK